MKKQINCWVTNDLAAEIEKAAAADDRSVSSWIRRLIVAALKTEVEAEAEAEAAA